MDPADDRLERIEEGFEKTKGCWEEAGKLLEKDQEIWADGDKRVDGTKRADDGSVWSLRDGRQLLDKQHQKPDGHEQNREPALHETGYNASVVKEDVKSEAFLLLCVCQDRIKNLDKNAKFSPWGPLFKAWKTKNGLTASVNKAVMTCARYDEKFPGFNPIEPNAKRIEEQLVHWVETNWRQTWHKNSETLHDLSKIKEQLDEVFTQLNDKLS